MALAVQTVAAVGEAAMAVVQQVAAATAVDDSATAMPGTGVEREGSGRMAAAGCSW